MNMRNPQKQVLKKALSIFEAIIASLIILVILGLFWPGPKPRHIAKRVVCLSNMKHLWLTLMLYSDENSSTYPIPEKWCDLIKPYLGGNNNEVFQCPAAEEKIKCHYAMNPNCKPDSPPDTVLLFEIKGGWNKFGGPEILTTQNHSGEGCNILFNGGYVQFISIKNIDDLKWE